MRSFELPVIPLAGSESVAGQLLADAAEWFGRISRGDCRIGYRQLPPAALPRPASWYAAMSGGKGAWPRNSQALLTEVVPPELRSGERLLLLSGPELLAHTWNLPRGSGDSRYAVLPPGSKLGTIVHEFGHLLFDWPDWNWPKAYENDCLMARGALMGGGTQPSPPCAPLLVREGWSTAVPLGRTTLVRELTTGMTGSMEWDGRQFLVEHRWESQGRLCVYPLGEESHPVHLALTPWDEDRAILGLLGSTLRGLRGGSRMVPGNPVPRDGEK